MKFIDFPYFCGMQSIENLWKLVGDIEHCLGYVFTNKEVLVLTFIHPSFFNENRESVTGHNERLEFLGDSVLGLIVSSYLYHHLPQRSEGELSHLRATLVGADACVHYIRRLEVEPFLMLGKGESANLGRGRERILADLFEAIIGAIYCDGGLEKAREFFLRHFSSYVDQLMYEPLRNWKADLQDYSQKKYQKPPEYIVVEEIGPAHSKQFIIAALIEGKEMGRGEGASKKLAEQAAAENALKAIEKEGKEHGEG